MTARDNGFTHLDGVTLKEYFDSRIDGLQEAIKTATDALNRRLEGMNEFRESLRDQTGKSVTRVECCSISDRIKEDIQMLRESKSNLEGKASQLSVNIAIVIAVLGVFVGLVSGVVSMLQFFRVS